MEENRDGGINLQVSYGKPGTVVRVEDPKQKDEFFHT